MHLRDIIKEKGKEELLKNIKKEMGEEMKFSGLEIDSLDRYDEVLGIKYDFEMKSDQEDIIYFNPMLGEGYKENLFKAATREYPVEMPYTMDETYNLQMDIPQGYVVDELPKSMMLKLNEDNEGFFEYRISQSANSISFRSRIRIGRANFLPDEYEMLREFFNYVVKKQAEQIVFKKKN
jgi:acyl carrier protein